MAIEEPAPLATVAVAVAEYATVRDLLRHGVSRLTRAGVSFGHGTANAFDDCRALIQFALSIPPAHFDELLDARLSAAERRGVAELIERRCESRLPAAYLTGEAWLAGVCFRSDRRALVPRSLIGEALHAGLDDWLDDEPKAVLDLCCGGGSLAVLAALAWSAASVVASDLSAEALDLAAENRALHGLDDRIELVRADLFEGVPGRRFDLVLCNPPYVNARSMGSLPAEYRAEPQMALAAGEDGMDLIRTIIGQVSQHLQPDGALLLEIGHEAPHFERAFPKLEYSYVPVTQGERMLVWLPARCAPQPARQSGRGAGGQNPRSKRR